jgi:hypothetical protein
MAEAIRKGWESTSGIYIAGKKPKNGMILLVARKKRSGK